MVLSPKEYEILLHVSQSDLDIQSDTRPQHCTVCITTNLSIETLDVGTDMIVCTQCFCETNSECTRTLFMFVWRGRGRREREREGEREGRRERGKGKEREREVKE